MKRENKAMRYSQRSKRALCFLAVGATILLTATQNAQALPRIERYVSVSVTPHELDLGSVPEPGLYDSPAILTVHVAANCDHGGVVASATPLERTEGGSIPPERIFVRIPATGEYVPMDAPVVITGPAGPGVFDVELKFRVETVLQNPPGTYTGTFTFTVGL